MSANVRGGHGRFLELAAAAIDFELSPAEVRELSAHLAVCPVCRRTADAMRADARTIQGLRSLEIPEPTARHLLVKAVRRPSTLTNLRVLAAAAALGLLAVGTAIVGSELLQRPTTPVTITPPPTSLASPGVTTSPVPPAPPDFRGVWRTVASLPEPRVAHTATVLGDGRVLVAGGHAEPGAAPLRATVAYQSSVDRWMEVGSLADGREFHVAVLLADGRVLVAGGHGDTGASIASAEIFDPRTDSWSPTGSMADARAEFAAAVLSDGRVLVSGGFAAAGQVLGTAELFDPVSGTWTPAPPLASARARHTATLLPDGRVLAAGGYSIESGWLGHLEAFDPLPATWGDVGDLIDARRLHTASLLPDGLVLMVGGTGAAGGELASAEAYDPTTGTMSAVDRLDIGRHRHAAVVLADGRLLIAGGIAGNDRLVNASIFESEGWLPAGELSVGRDLMAAARLPSGEVLFIGGEGLSAVSLDAVDAYLP